MDIARSRQSVVLVLLSGLILISADTYRLKDWRHDKIEAMTVIFVNVGVAKFSPPWRAFAPCIPAP